MLWWVRSRSREGVARACACADVSNASGSSVAVQHCQAVDRRMRGTLRDLLTCTFSSEPLHQHQRSSGKSAVQQSLTSSAAQQSLMTSPYTCNHRLQDDSLLTCYALLQAPFFFLLNHHHSRKSFYVTVRYLKFVQSLVSTKEETVKIEHVHSNISRVHPDFTLYKIIGRPTLFIFWLLLFNNLIGMLPFVVNVLDILFE